MLPTPNPSRTASKAARGTAAFIGLVALVLSLGWWWLHRPIPPLDGQLPVAGLESAVEVRFDSFAVPHVFATSDADAWRSVGYLQARDRLWQMELYRRSASGRLSELLGEATIVIDRRFLTLGLRRAAELEWQRTTPHVRMAFEHYSAGVNAAMRAAEGKLPLEYQLLRLEPEPWTPIDSLAIAKLFAWRLGENRTPELLRYSLTQELGARALELFPAPPDWAPVILESDQGGGVRGEGGKTGAVGAVGATGAMGLPAVLSAVAHGAKAEAQSAKAGAAGATTIAGLEWLFQDNHAMSNSWVIHGSRTASGRPLLANDPHLPIEMPSVWWEVHVVSDSLNVAGATIPGIPFIVIGHNARLGWGLTNAGADVQDFFIEQLDASRTRYRSGDKWLPLAVRRHEIRVRGRSEPIVFEVRSTSRGPVQNVEAWRDLQPGEPAPQSELGETVLAFKWDAIVQGESAVAFDALARAGGWTEFVAAVRRFSAPAQNFVYADVDGNIGYAMSGLLPVRGTSDGSMPVQAWPAGTDWRGSVDINQLPVELNPASGQIVTANNEVDRRLPYLTRDWVAPFRARRITEMLAGSRGLDIAAMAKIQADITSISAGWILDHIELPEEVQELRAWDRRMDDRPVAALYQAFEEALWRRTFADEMSAPLYDRFYRYAGRERFAGLPALITDAHSSWFDDRRTHDVVETREQVARQAGADAASSMRARFGDRLNWRWTEIHAAKFAHPLGGGGRLLDWFFSRGPVPLAGDGSTVNKTTTSLRRPYETSEAASYRQILEVGAWDRSVAISTTGQSGHPRSPHYFDQNVLWQQGRYRALPFTRGAVEAAMVSQVELVP
ncbi:MAG TPA: penicillin acylase family protein [Vicinamibacterales bacterium]|nr:penicillin acylase family protein [Vicinamibacterales bacterium]